MSPRTLVRAFALARLVLGAAVVAAPRRVGSSWVGPDAASPGATVLGRAFGARDVVLAGRLLHTVDHPQVAQRWIATCGLVDAVDGASVFAVRNDLPAARVVPFLAVAFGSAVGHLVLSQRMTSASGLEAAAARSTPAPASSPEAVMPDGADEAKRAMGARTIGVDTPK
jgi:hypothetical protein